MGHSLRLLLPKRPNSHEANYAFTFFLVGTVSSKTHAAENASIASRRRRRRQRVSAQQEEPEEGGTGSAIMDAMLGTSTGDKDEDLYAQAMAVILRDKRASTSYLQRRLKVGYNKAATLIERLEEDGVISAPNHAGKRTILRQGDPE